jgi:DAK2 domain
MGINANNISEILKQVGSVSQTNDPILLLTRIVHAVESSMDGTSGALYAIFLNSVLSSFKKTSQEGYTTVNTQTWAHALKSALEALSRYTPAKVGDRTLVDALQPFVKVLLETSDVVKAAEAGRKGAESTKGMKASLGRTVYVGGKGFEEVPDPGAWGLSEFFLGLAGLKRDEKKDQVGIATSKVASGKYPEESNWKEEDIKESDFTEDELEEDNAMEEFLKKEDALSTKATDKTAPGRDKPEEESDYEMI